jgi:hypothetical protein
MRKPCQSDVFDEEWALVAPYLTRLPKAAAGAGTACARSSKPCAGWCAPGRLGAGGRTILRPGPPVGAGITSDCLKRSPACVLSLACPMLARMASQFYGG